MREPIGHVVEGGRSIDGKKPGFVAHRGGIVTGTLVPHHPIVGWITRAHPTTTWTTSVCMGALLLAGAGVLTGVDAATHWGALDEFARLGAIPVRERVVRRGKIVTGAGVSAGIDMASPSPPRSRARTTPARYSS